MPPKQPLCKKFNKDIPCGAESVISTVSDDEYKLLEVYRNLSGDEKAAFLDELFKNRTHTAQTAE